MNTSLYNNPCYTAKELSNKKNALVLAQKQPVKFDNWYYAKQFQH